jgi:two-component system, sensor histidine kinase
MQRKTVLVVEDNRDELAIYTTLLSHRGYTILAASDFHSALDIARDQQPDLAVIDIHLGSSERDGCDLVAALRSPAGAPGIPVIAHTGYGDVYRKALERVGCDAVLHKPSNPQDLIGEVERFIGPP